MKKLVFILIFSFLLMGCTKKDVKEYTADEFSEIYWDVINTTTDEMSKLTDNELYGDATTDEEKDKNIRKVAAKLQAKAMEEYGMSYNQRIRVRGKLGDKIGSMEPPAYSMNSLDDDSDAIPFMFRMIDNTLSEAEEGAVVVIEGCFTKELANTGIMFAECTTISK